MQQEVQYTKEKRTRAKKRELIVLQSMRKKGVDLSLGRLFCIQKQNQWKWDWRKRRVKLSLVPRPFGNKEKTAKKLYTFLYRATEEAKWHHVDWGFEALKLLYGEGYAKGQDAGRLGALVRAVDEKGKNDCALRLMDGFALLYRHMPHEVQSIVSALSVLALYAYRNRQEALLAKCGDYLCRIALEEEYVTDAMITAIKQVGILAIKRQDTALFREMLTRGMSICYLRSVPKDKLISMLLSWLEKILEQSEPRCYEAWKDAFEDSVTQGRWDNEAMLRFIESCRALAAMSAMNPYAPLLRRFLNDMLGYAELSKNIEVKITAVQIVGMAMRIAVQDHKRTMALPYVAVLAKFGANLAYRQLQYPKLYETGEGRVLTAVWQVFLLLEQELQESTWSEMRDNLLPLYEDYQNAFPTKEREQLWWHALFAYREQERKMAVPQGVQRLTSKERSVLIH